MSVRVPVVGIGADGLPGLAPASRAVLEEAGAIHGAPRQLAGLRVGDRARPGDAAGLPRVAADLNARSALSVMLREGAEAVAVVDEQGQVRGVVGWQALEQA